MGQVSLETPGGIQMEGKDMKKRGIKGEESPRKERSLVEKIEKRESV